MFYSQKDKEEIKDWNNMEKDMLDKWLIEVNKEIKSDSDIQKDYMKKIQELKLMKENHIKQRLTLDTPRYKEVIKLNQKAIDTFTGDNSYNKINHILYSQIISKALENLKFKKQDLGVTIKPDGDYRDKTTKDVDLKVFIGKRGISTEVMSYWGTVDPRAYYLGEDRLDLLFYIITNFRDTLVSKLRSDKGDMIKILANYTSKWYTINSRLGKRMDYKFTSKPMLVEKEVPYRSMESEMGLAGLESRQIDTVTITLNTNGIHIEPRLSTSWTRVSSFEMASPIDSLCAFNICQLPDDVFNTLKEIITKAYEGHKKNLELIQDLKRDISPYIMAKLI